MIQVKKLSGAHVCAFHNLHFMYVKTSLVYASFSTTTYIHWEIQKSIYIYLDISIELWALNLFTSVIIKVEYILFCSIFASKKILKISKGIKCTKNYVLPHCRILCVNTNLKWQ